MTTTVRPTRSATTAPSRQAAPVGLADARPYQGDDRIQSMARVMALPMLAMGAMAVLAGLVTSIVAGTSFGDAFSPAAELGDLGRGQALSQVTGALLFLGMGMILGGITMLLVNIVGALRDAGREVQESVGAPALQMAKPLSGRLTPVVMLAGLMTEFVAFGIGIVAAVTIGNVAPASLADAGAASSADLADIGLVQAVSAWLPGLRLVGLAVILVSVVLALTTIRRSIGFQGRRLTQLAGAA